MSKTFSSQTELSSKYLSAASLELISRSSAFSNQKIPTEIPSHIDVILQVDWAAMTLSCSDDLALKAPDFVLCQDVSGNDGDLSRI